MPLGRQLDEQLVDLVLGADVDAPRGLVGDEHPRLAQQRPREHQLLLVAARQAVAGASRALGAG